MNALDAAYYFAERPGTPLHIASVTVLEGPPPPYGQLVRMVQAKLPLVPRYRRRVRTAPFNLDRPLLLHRVSAGKTSAWQRRRSRRPASASAPGVPDPHEGPMAAPR